MTIVYLCVEVFAFIGYLILCYWKPQHKVVDMAFYKIQYLVQISMIPGVNELTKLSQINNGYGSLAGFVNIFFISLVLIWMLNSYYRRSTNINKKGLIQEYIFVCEEYCQAEQQQLSKYTDQNKPTNIKSLWVFLIFGLAVLSSILCGTRKSHSISLQVSLTLDVAWLGYFCYMYTIRQIQSNLVFRQELFIAFTQIFYWFFTLMFSLTRIQLFLSLILGSCVVNIFILAFFSCILLRTQINNLS
eukprot:TRINITY_DN17431_c0_g3_i1.p2 TRINITY_DN17431_c0_g3~~TRINITY_DN17431_c0_g3_i1.p2  ORF type:complete len:245 (-),score=-21.18 TRINITY_DN17431_c0_g3_i1:130-864(-)